MVLFIKFLFNNNYLIQKRRAKTFYKFSIQHLQLNTKTMGINSKSFNKIFLFT